MYRAVMTSKPLIPSFCLLPLAAMATACGCDDPTPDREDAASGAAVNAAVDEAQMEANMAANAAERVEEAEARGAALAEQTIARADSADSNESVFPVD